MRLVYNNIVFGLGEGRDKGKEGERGIQRMEIKGRAGDFSAVVTVTKCSGMFISATSKLVHVSPHKCYLSVGDPLGFVLDC